MIGGSGEKITLRLTAEHADAHNAFGPVENFRHKMEVLDRWCAEIGRNPREIERTVAVRPEELDSTAAYEDAGADHLIVMLGSPFDLSAVEKAIAAR
jgi:alkanesulfonate monooxygenase SsuD/methylene tetrahydromethanopterin reductase-like flavin-dependent oxidoreductase (luciferase family)